MASFALDLALLLSTFQLVVGMPIDTRTTTASTTSAMHVTPLQTPLAVFMQERATEPDKSHTYILNGYSYSDAQSLLDGAPLISPELFPHEHYPFYADVGDTIEKRRRSSEEAIGGEGLRAPDHRDRSLAVGAEGGAGVVVDHEEGRIFHSITQEADENTSSSILLNDHRSDEQILPPQWRGHLVPGRSELPKQDGSDEDHASTVFETEQADGTGPSPQVKTDAPNPTEVPPRRRHLRRDIAGGNPMPPPPTYDENGWDDDHYKGFGFPDNIIDNLSDDLAENVQCVKNPKMCLVGEWRELNSGIDRPSMLQMEVKPIHCLDFGGGRDGSCFTMANYKHGT